MAKINRDEADRAYNEYERDEMLLSQPEVEVTEAEFAAAFSVNCEDVKFVKRSINGKLAEDIRKRLSAPADSEVLISELEGDAQIGDETWENFGEMIIECNGHKIEFDNHEAVNNFVAMMNWLAEGPESAK